MIVNPFRSPRKEDQQYTRSGAYEDEHQDSQASHPELNTCVAMGFGILGRFIEHPSTMRQFTPQRAGHLIKRNVGIGVHALPPRKRAHRVRRFESRPIRPFYDFRALMRSATSR